MHRDEIEPIGHEASLQRWSSIMIGWDEPKHEPMMSYSRNDVHEKDYNELVVQLAHSSPS